MCFYNDNKWSMNVAHDPEQYDHTKHIKVDWDFIKEKLESDIICKLFIIAGDQLACILTKEAFMYLKGEISLDFFFITPPHVVDLLVSSCTLHVSAWALHTSTCWLPPIQLRPVQLTLLFTGWTGIVLLIYCTYYNNFIVFVFIIFFISNFLHFLLEKFLWLY